MREKGSVLILALITVAVLAVIGMAGILMSQREISAVVSAERSTAALQIADAGANYVYNALVTDPLTPLGDFSNISSISQEIDFSSDYAHGMKGRFFLPTTLPDGTSLEGRNPRIMAEFMPPFPPGVGMGEGIYFLAIQFYVEGDLTDTSGNNIISSKIVDTATLGMFFGEY